MRGIYVDLPEELVRQARHFIVDADMTFKELVRKALEEFMTKEKGGKR